MSSSAPHPGLDERIAPLLALDSDAVRCPFPIYESLREQSPVAWSDRLHAWVVSRHDDILQVLRDPETFSSTMASGPSSITPLARRIADDPAYPERTRRQARRRIALSESPVLLLCDPPMHRRQRGLVSAAFSPRRVTRMEPDIQRISHELIDGFAADGTVELVSQFAVPLPMTVIATVLGVPPQLMGTFKEWSDAFTGGVGRLDNSPDMLAEMFQHVDDFYEYFTAQIDRRRGDPADDLLTDLLAARLDDEQPLTLDEMLNMLVQFLVAGNETTTNLIATLAHILASSDDLAARVRADRSLVPGLVEESLRLEAPIQGMFRHTKVDTTIDGQPIPAGSAVYVVYASANRDPAAFPEPDALHLDDARAHHLAFGRGEHVCLGATIARREAQVAVNALLNRLERWWPAEAMAYRPSFVLHGPSRLPLMFTARSESA